MENVFNTKTCITCKIEKPIEVFYLRSDTGKRRNQCNFCYKKYKKSKLLLTKEIKENLNNGFRKCNKCLIVKKLEFFSIDNNTSTNYCTICKECKNKYSNDNKTNLKNNRLKRLYNISIEEFNSLLLKQNDKCAICGNIVLSNKCLTVDHNHDNGKIRGLLCNNCNSGLGQFKDNINNLK